MHDQSVSTQQTDPEGWFLAQLEINPIPVRPVLAFLDGLNGSSRKDQARIWAEMLQDTLAGQKARDEGLLVLARRVAWGLLAPAQVREALLRLLEGEPEQKWVEYLGFDRGVAPSECLRRFQVLLALKPGALVYEKKWGFGVLRSVDHFYARVEIDFDKKPRHQMTLAYAAESLDLLGEDHLLAQKHRDPESLRRQVAEAPGEVVRTALRSFGPMTAGQLQEALVPSVVADGDWKRFWDAARKALKNDPLVDVPSKRTEPIRLLQKALSLDDDWFRALAAERDMAVVLGRLDELMADAGALEGLTEASRAILADRLAFVIKGAGRRQPGLLTRAYMLARQLKISPEVISIQAHAEACFADDELMLDILKDFPARLMEPFLQFLTSVDEARTLDRLMALLPRLEMTALGEVMSLLLQKGRDEACAAFFRKAVLGQTIEVELLLWLARNPDRIEAWGLGPIPRLSDLMLRELEEDYMGERLKAQNQLRDRFEQKEWLRQTFEPLENSKRREWLERIKASEAWPTVDRQSVMARVIKQFPELEVVLAAKPAVENARALLTSTRMYRERQAQLEKIVNVEIPRVAREIGVARSYGDLRENYEYKAAKEMQSFLLRRRGELEIMLRDVRPTDFKDMPHECVGVATGVVLAHPDGRKEQYFVLGEWDQDDKLHIISAQSRLARVLEGHKPGDEVIVPSETGEVACTVEQVTELSPEVRAWVEERPET